MLADFTADTGESINITHVFPRLQRGGALRSTLDVARAGTAQASDNRCFISLGGAEPAAIRWVQEEGHQVLQAHATTSIQHALEQSDIVHLAAWNTPELYAWLASPLPPMRLVMTLHVTGEFPSQVATPLLLDNADWIVAATPHSLTLPSFQQQIAARPDRIRVVLDSTSLPDTNIVLSLHEGIRIGYAGTVDFVKMHPRFVELCAGAAAPDATFAVAGAGGAIKTLKRQARAYPHVRFEFLGYLENVREFLATCDIFGYPLARDTYAAGELILQEAMWLGVPPVVLAVGGLPYLVKHNETGLVARDENEYIELLQDLVGNSIERERLGRNAREFARRHFGAARVAPELRQVYDQAMRLPKRERVQPAAPDHALYPGARALIRSFGEWSEPYQTSLDSTDPEAVRAAEFRIANASPLEASPGAGGILDYRLHYPTDPMLRLWSGLTLGTNRHYAFAAAEFTAAGRLGLAPERIGMYLQRVRTQQPPFEDSLTWS